MDVSGPISPGAPAAVRVPPAASAVVPIQPQAAPDGAGADIIRAQRDAAEKGYLFGLGVAQTQDDRVAIARTFLRYARGLTNAERSDGIVAGYIARAKSTLAQVRPGRFSSLE